MATMRRYKRIITPHDSFVVGEAGGPEGQIVTGIVLCADSLAECRVNLAWAAVRWAWSRRPGSEKLSWQDAQISWASNPHFAVFLAAPYSPDNPERTMIQVPLKLVNDVVPAF